MPKLILFAPSKLAAFDSVTGVISVMGLLTGLDVNVPADIPIDAIAPAEWVVTSVYSEEEGDAGKAFEQRVQLIAPNGQAVIETKVTFVVASNTHNLMQRIQGQPIGQSGVYRLILDFRVQDESEEWATIGEFPIRITHKEIHADTIRK